MKPSSVKNPYKKQGRELSQTHRNFLNSSPVVSQSTRLDRKEVPLPPPPVQPHPQQLVENVYSKRSNFESSSTNVVQSQGLRQGMIHHTSQEGRTKPRMRNPYKKRPRNDLTTLSSRIEHEYCDSSDVKMKTSSLSVSNPYKKKSNIRNPYKRCGDNNYNASTTTQKPNFSIEDPGVSADFLSSGSTQADERYNFPSRLVAKNLNPKIAQSSLDKEIRTTATMQLRSETSSIPVASTGAKIVTSIRDEPKNETTSKTSVSNPYKSSRISSSIPNPYKRNTKNSLPVSTSYHPPKISNQSITNRPQSSEQRTKTMSAIPQPQSQSQSAVGYHQSKSLQPNLESNGSVEQGLCARSYKQSTEESTTAQALPKVSPALINTAASQDQDHKISASNLSNCCKNQVKDLPHKNVNLVTSKAQGTSQPSGVPKVPSNLAYDENRVKPVKDQYHTKLMKAADLRGTLKNGWTLFPHQKAGIVRAIQMRRIILAFDMGLGKTLIGCIWAKAFKNTFPNLKVYVIAPVSLKKEWRRTATDVVGLECEEDKGAKAQLDEKSLDLRVTSWAKVPTEVPRHIDHYVVICDEAHNLQSMNSGRTKDTLKLVSHPRCVGVLLLTGTPMKNGKPSNLFPLLKAVRHPFADDQRMYEVYFCNGQHKTFNNQTVWDASGSSNLHILHAHIKYHVAHKTKEECLKQLPGKTREFKTVPVASKYEIQHNKALTDLANVFQANENNAYDDDGGGDAILGSFTRLRQIAALAKIDATVSLVKSILEDEGEPSIVIFTFFVEVGKLMKQRLSSLGWNGELFTGGTSASKRQEMVDNFQSGITPVFIATFGAGGVGITLTAARTIILMDRPWTPGDALQAEDRIRRIGQTKQVRSIWLRCFEVDEQIDSLIEHKQCTSIQAINPAHKNSSNHDNSKGAPKISIKKLVQTIVARK